MCAINQEINVLKPKEVHIWQTTFSRTMVLEPYLQMLSSDEITRVHKFKFEVDKKRYIISRGLLRVLLGRYLAEDPKKIVFIYNEYGKPDCNNIKNLKFNISHSGDMALFGFSYNQGIGVDIEEIKNDFDSLEIADNFFSKKEIACLHNTTKSEQNRAFYRCWTRKEAFIKAEGSGLSFPLDRFTVTLDHDIKASLQETKWQPEERLNWHLSSYVPAKNYIAALAIRDKIKFVKYFNWDDTSSKLS